MSRLVLACCFLGLVPAALTARAVAPAHDVVERAIANPSRPPEDRAADALRKPAETLDFAGVRPGMRVGEFYPGGGYFTRLLSDVVGPSGRVYGLENRGWKMAVEADRKLVADGPWKNVTMDDQPFGTVRFPVPLDLAWVTQNYHDLKIHQYGDVDTVAFDRAVYAALKPGGIFFVLDHQGKPGMSDADIAKVHRIDRDVVVREITSAGFKLVAEGNFLRRATDDHSKPITDESVKGRTDQYALKFIKPQS